MTKKEFWDCIAIYIPCSDCPGRDVCPTIKEDLFCHEKLMIIYDGLQEEEDNGRQ